jgi:chorismate synthase
VPTAVVGVRIGLKSILVSDESNSFGELKPYGYNSSWLPTFRSSAVKSVARCAAGNPSAKILWNFSVTIRQRWTKIATQIATPTPFWAWDTSTEMTG